MTWLLCDYGEVLSLPRPAAAVEALAELCGMDRAGFEVAYWAQRPAYDRGDLEAEAYWAATLGRAPGGDLPRLVETDTAGWLHLNQASVDAAHRAAGRGWRLAILSNAPREVAAAVDGLAPLAAFAPRLFSCDLRSVKPDPEIYALALDRLGSRPTDVVFVDDRPANVEAARAAGLHAEVFTGPEVLDALTRGRSGPG